jgi:hypothetical protein
LRPVISPGTRGHAFGISAPPRSSTHYPKPTGKRRI